MPANQCFRILSFILTILFVYLLQSSIGQATAKNNVALRLVDVNMNPIAHVRLTAWRTNAFSPQKSANTGFDGIASLNLPPGQYYFTGDITKLKNRAPYNDGLNNLATTTLYFISKPFSISNNIEFIALKIDSADYISLVDIAGIKGFQVHISQSDLGIETNVCLKATHNWLKLYLPPRMQYTIQKIDGILHMQWPIYAAPGLQFTFSP